MTLHVRQLTAGGRGAVAVLKVFGTVHADVAGELARHFTAVNNIPLVDAPTNRILYGTWQSDGADEDVVIVKTGPTEWEVCCHGGVAAVERIKMCLTASRLPGKDHPSGSLDDLLLQCPTLRTAEYVLAHRNGLLAEFAELTGRISNEDLTSRLRTMLSHRQFAAHLTQPWTVAIAGCPNAGKSSLLNATIGYDRSIVFAEPGTTRDRVEATTVIDGWPYQLLDTAGVRDAAHDQVEHLGVSIAASTFVSADIGLLVVDSTIGLQDVDFELLSSNPGGRPLAVVWNKTDLPESKPPPDVSRHVLPISTTRKDGLANLLEWLVEATVATPPPLTEPLPIGRDLVEAIEQFLDGRTEVGQLRTAFLT